VRFRCLPVVSIAMLPVSGLTGPAAGEVVVGRDARTAVALTVYSGQDLAVVHETRTVDLGAGESTLRFEDVPATLDPRSVVLRATDDQGTLAVLEQSYLFDLASPQALVERWVGRAVELVDTDQRLRTRITSATLLSTEGGNVYRIGDRIAVGHPGWLFLPPSGDEVFTRPTLRWQVANTGAARRALEASYAITGLSWAADYAIVLGAEETHADVSAWATLTNQTGTRYDDAALVLVAGEVHRAGGPSPPPPPFPVLKGRAATAAAPPEPEAFAEYYRYALERRISLAEKETKQLPLLAVQGVTVAKRYEMSGDPIWFRQPIRDRDRRVGVAVVLTLADTDANHLGRDLPAGTAHVYQVDASGAWELVGEDRLRQTAKNETAEIAMGQASDIVATRTQTDWRKVEVEPYQAESAYEVKVRNNKRAAVTVVVRERVDGDWKVLESSLPARKVDARTLAFDVPVPAGDEAVLRYRIQVGQ
jgi:hypothetical protein